MWMNDIKAINFNIFSWCITSGAIAVGFRKHGYVNDSKCINMWSHEDKGSGVYHVLFFSDLHTIIIACIAIGFVILLIIAGTVIALKCRENANHKPPSTILLQEEQYRMNKGPLPPIPENGSHYRSLIRQPDSQAFSPHSQTMPRSQPQVVQGCDDYSADYEWKFGTAPWHKPAA